MSNVNGVPNSQYNVNNLKTDFDKNDIELEEISFLYTTTKQETERGTFDETFNKVNVSEVEQGEKFLNGLIDNKQKLMEDLNLSDDQYDSLACISLALASQETGMSYEDGYNSENQGLGGLFRKFEKWAHVKFFGGDSASSGLTQMKIYDFLNDPTKLSEEQRNILKDYGITADGIATNNLYDNPDKAAVATMVVLKSITEKYEDYKNILSSNHDSLGAKLGLNTEEEKANAVNKGDKILSEISSIYSKANDSEKVKIRKALKECFIAYDDTKIGDKTAPDGSKLSDEYNEEIQVNELNELLDGKFELSISDLDHIRYALTDANKEMNKTEFCAFGWNKGTNDNSLKLDRLLADKVGTILSNPEDFDYDQFTVNVSSLAFMYANQTIDRHSF